MSTAAKRAWWDVHDDAEERCQEHPNWPASTCAFCHPETAPGGPGVIDARLSKRTRWSVEMQTGIPVRDRHDVERLMERQGYHALEKGEPAEVSRRELREWAAQPAGTRGPLPPSMKPQPPKEKGIDTRELLRRIRKERRNARPPEED